MPAEDNKKGDDYISIVAQAQATRKRVFILRIIVACCLLALCFLCGYFGYSMLRNYQQKLFNEQYRSIIDTFSDSVSKDVKSHLLGVQSLSKVLGNHCPQSSVWPYCYIRLDSHQFLIKTLKNSISTGSIVAILPIIYPSQVSEYEKTFREIVLNDTSYAFENMDLLGMSSFGWGIYGRNATINPYNDTHYHDTTGISPCSKHQLLTPVTQISDIEINYNVVNFNSHSLCSRSIPEDAVIDCLLEGKSVGDCSFGISEFTTVVTAQGPWPGTIVFSPIFPAENSTHLVGFTGILFTWVDVLQNSVPSYLNGIDCVIQCADVQFTYTISHGKVEPKGHDIGVESGKGDLHESKYSSYGYTMPLSPSTGVIGNEYYLTFYPTRALHKQFINNDPLVVSFGSMLLIIAVSILFFSYDYLMRSELLHKELILNSKREFVRFISHEIRTPMNVVCVGLKQLAEEMFSLEINSHDSQPKLDECMHLVQEMYHSSESAVVVLSDLISYDKIEMGKLLLEKKPVIIWQVISNSVKAMGSLARHSNVQLLLEMDFVPEVGKFHETEDVTSNPDLSKLRVIGDEIKLSEVFRRLFSCAIALSPPHSTIVVAVSWHESYYSECMRIKFRRGYISEGFIRCEIKEFGFGENVPRLRDHYNLKKLHSGPGSGLGLWLSQDIVRQHGGVLSLSSSDTGLGSTFIVELPLIYVAEAATARVAVSLYEPPNIWKSVRTALIADDSDLNRKMICRMLRKEDITCHEANDGDQCISQVFSLVDDAAVDGNVMYDLILLDYEMPRMNGPTTAKSLREAGCKSVIIGMTGHTDPDELNYFKSCGANEVIIKPITLETLIVAYINSTF